MKAELAVAKSGPMTWYVPDDDRWYKDANGKACLFGPRGFGLTVAKVAAAEAYLDGFARVEAGHVYRLADASHARRPDGGRLVHLARRHRADGPQHHLR
jgi:hypothetical protein